MPIHLDILNPRQAEAGKIKIGGSKARGKGGGKIPQKYDHFVITSTVRDPKTENFELDEALMNMLPGEKDDKGVKKIRELSVLVDSDDLDEVFPNTLACYAGRKLHCRGDGKVATRWSVEQEKTDNGTRWVRTGKVQTDFKCTCKYLNAKKGFVCKPHGTLWVTIVAGEETRLGARHCFRTTSWNSIRWIRSGLETIQRQVGTVVGMPLTMILRPHHVQTEDGQKTVYVVHIELRTKNLLALQQHAIKAAHTRQQVWSVASRPTVLGLPSPGKHESAADQSDIQQEFHPDDHDLDGDDEGEDEDDVAFDPETGEVYDTTVVDAHSEPSAPAPSAPENETQVPEEDPNALLPDGHHIRVEFQKLLNEIAIDRDFSEADAKKGRAEIWAEAVEAAGYPRLPWKDLTRARAQKIYPKLKAMLRDPDATGRSSAQQQDDGPP